MHIFEDYQGREIRLTDDGVEHIQRRHEEVMVLQLDRIIPDTLKLPDMVVQSDSSAVHYYRWYIGTEFGDKYLCVVVATSSNERYIRTAYLTSRIRKGRVLWEKE